MRRVAVIDYGMGNLRSVSKALETVAGDVTVEVTSDPTRILTANHVVFPGVGAMRDCVAELKRLQLDDVIRNVISNGTPILGICLGMQLMCEWSEENNTKALGVFPIKVKRFQVDLKVPQIGWNNIWDLKTDLFNSIEEKSFMYFVHSYYVPENEFSIANSDYGINFSAAIQKDNFYACQFHPEKSGNIGQQILKNFIEI